MLFGMSYQITVTAHGGRLEVSHAGTVPDGQYRVNGHEDDQHRELAITHLTHEGRQVATAGSSHNKER